MMDTKSISLIASLMALLSVNLHSAPLAGLVSADSQGVLYLSTVRDISRTAVVHFQYPDQGGNLKCCKTRTGASFLKIESAQNIMDANTSNLAFRYKLTELKYDGNFVPFVGLAVVGNELIVVQKNERELHTRKKKGSSQSIQSCFSMEGLHVLGPKWKASENDLYLALDYSVENPTCDNDRFGDK